VTLHRFTHRLARLEDAHADARVSRFFARLERCLAAGIAEVHSALDDVHRQIAESERTVGRPLGAAELLQLPAINATVERLVDLASSAANNR